MRAAAIPTAVSVACLACSGSADDRAAQIAEVRWYAVHALRLHDDGRGLRLDLDGRVTSETDSQGNVNTCRRAPGAPVEALADGPRGEDDNFAQHLVQELGAGSVTTDRRLADDLRTGRATLLLKLEGVFGPNEDVRGALYLGAGLPAATFSTHDHWPTLGGPVANFATGKQLDGRWYGTGATLDLAPLLTDGEAPFVVEDARLSLDLSTGEGVFGGAMRPSVVHDAIPTFLAQLACTNDAISITTLQAKTAWAADLVLGAPNLQDTTKTCDAISFGLAFEASRTGEPRGHATLAKRSPCP